MTGTDEFYALAEQTPVGEREIEEALRRYPAAEVRALLEGDTPWRRALAQRALELRGLGRSGEADWLAVFAAASPGEVRDALERVEPTERGAKRRVAARRKQLAGAPEDELARGRTEAIAALGEQEVRQVFSALDCYCRLVAVAADESRTVAEREAAVTLAADDYNAVRDTVGAPRHEEIRARARAARSRRRLGDELGRLRREGVTAAELGAAIATVGPERVRTALEQDAPFGRLCVLAAEASDGDERQGWLTVGGAGPQSCWRAIGREVWAGSDAHGTSEAGGSDLGAIGWLRWQEAAPAPQESTARH